MKPSRGIGTELRCGIRFDAHKMPGPFGIYSFTKNESTAQAMDVALQALQKLHKHGITAEELASAKSYIKGQFPPSLETSRQLARMIAVHEFYGLDDREINDLEARIDAVTPAIAQQVIQKHFPADNLVFTLIGKNAEIGPAVKKYAEKQDMRVISEPGFWPPPAEQIMVCEILFGGFMFNRLAIAIGLLLGFVGVCCAAEEAPLLVQAPR